MKTKKLDTITREEFDRRLDAFNEQKQWELQRREEELMRVEQLLAHYEQILEEIEGGLRADAETSSSDTTLRRRLQELALKTAKVAASL